MFLAEMLRDLSTEENLVADTATYSTGDVEQDYGDLVTKNITLSAESKVLISWESRHGDSGSDSWGASRLLVNGVAVQGQG